MQNASNRRAFECLGRSVGAHQITCQSSRVDFLGIFVKYLVRLSHTKEAIAENASLVIGLAKKHLILPAAIIHQQIRPSEFNALMAFTFSSSIPKRR